MRYGGEHRLEWALLIAQAWCHKQTPRQLEGMPKVICRAQVR